MGSLAVLILTYNEAGNIRQCIESARFADEIIVVDSFSTDNTRQIATAAGAKVFEHAFDEGFAAQRNYALKCSDCDWVFYLDADERITAELADAIRKAAAGPAEVSYEVLRLNHVLGKALRHGAYQPDWSQRLYPRLSVQWEGRVHERPLTTVKKRRLGGMLLHYTYPDWEKYFSTFNRYTTMMAAEYFAAGKRPAGNFGCVLRGIFAFIQAYFLRQGFRDGKSGLTLSVYHGFYTMTKYQKLLFLHEKQQWESAR